MKKILALLLALTTITLCTLALYSCSKDDDDDEEDKENGEYEFKVTDYLAVFYFEDNETAKNFYENDESGTLEDIKEILGEEDEDVEYKIGKSGSMVWMGTKDAIKAAK